MCQTTYLALSILSEFRQKLHFLTADIENSPRPPIARDGWWRQSWQASLWRESLLCCQPVINSPSEDGRFPQPGIVSVEVSSYPMMLFTWVCSFVTTLIYTHCPFHGSSGCGGRADSDHRVVGATPCAGEGTRRVGECPRGQREQRCGGRAAQQDYWARLRASTACQRCSLVFDRVLSGCHCSLSVQEMDLERHKAFTPSTGGICHQSRKSFMSAWPDLKMNAPSRSSNCHGRLGRYPMPWST
jgi:hypothetical protein